MSVKAFGKSCYDKLLLSTLLHELRLFTNRQDDDLVDRFNHRYTVNLLAVSLFIISSKQYFGEPIIWYGSLLSFITILAFKIQIHFLIISLAGLHLNLQLHKIPIQIQFGKFYFLKPILNRFKL